MSTPVTRCRWACLVRLDRYDRSELAHASVMGALCAAIAIIAVVLPHAGGLGLLGTVPMGLLAYRYRIRVLITATVAAGVIGFLVVGLSGFGAVALCAYRRRAGWNRETPRSRHADRDRRRPLAPVLSSVPWWSSR